MITILVELNQLFEHAAETEQQALHRLAGFLDQLGQVELDKRPAPESLRELRAAVDTYAYNLYRRYEDWYVLLARLDALLDKSR